MIKKSWVREVARDTLALGSIPFYFIVIIRAIIGDYTPFVVEMVTAGVIIASASYFIKADFHIARGLAVTLFASLFYKVYLFTLFSFLLWMGIVLSSWYLKKGTNQIVLGVLIGIVSTAIGYWISTNFY